ncbi:MAG: Hpt domain-containing protein [Bdellovibrionaceae bacterium]|nr:Hpt domain-containing protein [Pseudobdellovibrionaceae bacterium]
MDDFDRELKVGFLDEAGQAVADVEQCFLDLERNPNNTENLNKIFRLAHNLKGSSKAVGFDKFGEFTHQFESFILKVKNGELAVSARVVSLLLRANDHVAYLIHELKNNLDAHCDSSGLINEMAHFVDDVSEAEVAEPVTTDSVSVFPEIDLANLSIEEIQALAFEQDQKEEVVGRPTPIVQQNIVPSVEVKLAAVEVATEEKQTKAPVGSVVEESLRVSLSKVEKLINFVGEMTILQSVLKEQVSNVESSLLKKTVQQIGKVSKEIQDLSMGLRMVPIKPTFQKMQRIVRDTAQTLGKEVSINLIGEETELDKTVRLNNSWVNLSLK